jgi:hypothetical protein
MATTTPNYGWTVPTSSDLVKNGATAIETLGDSVDDSLWNVGYGQAGKNKIINGDFRINQRNFTSTTTSGAYGFDRFFANGVDGTTTYSAQTFTPGTAPVAGYEGVNFARVASTGQTLATAQSNLRQHIENARTFAGQTVTVSFWAKAATATPNVAIELQQYFGSGGSPSTTVNYNLGKVTLSTSWQRFSASIALSSLSGVTFGTNNDSSLLLILWTSAGSNFNARTGTLGIQTATIDFWGVQVEYGSKATPFQTATGTIQGELFACKYYFERRQGGTSFGSIPLFGQCISTTSVYIPIFYTPKRTTPTLTQGGTWKQYTANATANAATYSLVARSANDGYAVATTSGMVAGSASVTEWDTSSYLDISSEL